VVSEVIRALSLFMSIVKGRYGGSGIKRGGEAVLLSLLIIFIYFLIIREDGGRIERGGETS